jgi:hypothetical protein
MRLERFALASSTAEIAVNPDHVIGVSNATDQKGIPILGVCGIMTLMGVQIVKGTLGEVCQTLEGTHSSRLVP